MFLEAKPVYPVCISNLMNNGVAFAASVPQAKEATLTVTGASEYLICINGSFLHHGPARTCPGKFRVDVLPVGNLLTEEKNAVVIRLITPRANSYSTLDQPGFLQAEVRAGDTVLAATGRGDDFFAVTQPDHVRKTPRYSFQRTFVESFHMTPETERFYTDPASTPFERLPLEILPEKTLIPRDICYPVFEKKTAVGVVRTGSAVAGERPAMPPKREYNPDPVFRCFTLDEMEENPVLDLLANRLTPDETPSFTDPRSFGMKKNSFVLLDMGQELTGMITMEIEAKEDAKVIFSFDEILRDGMIQPLRLDSAEVASAVMKKGNYRFRTTQAYSFRYLMLVTDGEITVKAPGLDRVGFPEITKKLASPDPDEQKIYAAAVETFRQNTYDIYMDCPSRERSGWLCDSFFTSRTEYALTGKSRVERAFLDNFILADSFPGLPEGMLPMCWPSDHPNGNYIPNWAMWYVLELAEYEKRTGDRDLIDRAKDKVLALCRFFEQYENGDGLLERLPAWVFVEWSMANNLVQDVNYPSNALYAGMLDAVDSLYGVKAYAEKAEKIRKYIRENTLVNGFFCDNSARQPDGKLLLSGMCTEVCQYYMFFFGVASEKTHPELWNTLVTAFGPDRKEKGLYPEIYPANAFIGNYLRLELLHTHGLDSQLLAETKGYFLYMAERTGTLWENDGDYASCNHGFASHAAYWLLAIRGEA